MVVILQPFFDISLIDLFQTCLFFRRNLSSYSHFLRIQKQKIRIEVIKIQLPSKEKGTCLTVHVTV